MSNYNSQYPFGPDQQEPGTIQFKATRETAEALRNWHEKHGKEKAIAAACGMIDAAIGSIRHLCGDRETYEWLQRKCDSLLDSELPR